MGLLAALAVGLVIGLERGWRARAVADGGRVAGLRTFALVGLLGGVLALAGPLLLAAGAVGLALIGVVGYRESVRLTGNLSATSAVALLLSFGLGALAALDAPGLAVSAAVLVAVLLDLRPAIHRWLRMVEHPELSAALQLLVLSAVVLPLLPDAPLGPYRALNPYRLWWAVVMVAGLSMTGHVAMRLVGPQAGALWTGLLGGLASSTGATLALARRVRVDPTLLPAALVGGLAATAMMCLRMGLIVGVLAPQLALRVLPGLLAAAAVMVAGALWQWRQRPVVAAADANEGRSDPGANGGNSELRPFDLGAALGFGAFLALMAVLTEAARQGLGAAGLYGLALLSGLADVDAITVSLARLHGGGSLAAPVASLALGLALFSSLAAKAAIAGVNGSTAMAWRLALAYGAALLAAGGMLAVAA